MMVQVNTMEPDRTQQNTNFVMNGLVFNSCKTLVNEYPFSSQQELFSNKPRQDRLEASLVGKVGITNGVLRVINYGHTCHLKRAHGTVCRYHVLAHRAGQALVNRCL